MLYSVTDLGSLGGNSTFGYGLNNVGQVVGASTTPSGFPPHAFMYSAGQMQDLGVLPGFDLSEAHGINDAGQVIGSLYSSTLGGPSRGFLYSNGQMTDLGLPGTPDSINNAGQIAGAYTRNAIARAFLYENGQLTDLGTLPGGMASDAYGINNAGQITGTSSVSGDFYSHAFLYSNGQMTDIQTLEGYESDGRGINDRGQVTGQRIFQLGPALLFHAFLYSDGRMIDLGTLGGSDGSSSGNAINNKGQVVGTASATFSSPSQAFIYSNGEMINLNNLIDPNLGITLGDATAINEEGQIVANSLRGRSYLLTPISDVPEPSTWALLGIPALLSLVWFPQHPLRKL